MFVVLPGFAFSSQDAPPPSDETIALSDLGDNPSQSQAIRRMVSQGIIAARTPTQFAPQEPMTRGEFILALDDLFQLPRHAGTKTFTDIPPGSPLYAALEAIEPYLGRQLLCPGCALGTNLLPDQPISKEEAIFAITRILADRKKVEIVSPIEANTVLSNISDEDQIPKGARIYFASAIKSGLLTIGPTSAMNLAAAANRAEAAVLLDSVQRAFDFPTRKRSR